MPLTQPERDNPLMRRYFQQINLPGAQLARRCGVAHSQIYMARRRNVGPDNAEKISGGIARILGLPEGERLRLKAEIMGHPDNLVRAWLGDSRDAARLLGEEEPIGVLVINPEKTLAHRSGWRVVSKLEELGAPLEVVEDVRARVRPEAKRPLGKVTNTQRGLKARNKRAAALFNLHLFKPRTHEAMQRARLSRKQVYERAGIGRETLRKALYERCGKAPAERIVHVLAQELGLSEQERVAIREELTRAPEKNF
jgi:transcriptional regulator with XRE-family HTH domain